VQPGRLKRRTWRFTPVDQPVNRPGPAAPRRARAAPATMEQSEVKPRKTDRAPERRRLRSPDQRGQGIKRPCKTARCPLDVRRLTWPLVNSCSKPVNRARLIVSCSALLARNRPMPGGTSAGNGVVLDAALAVAPPARSAGRPEKFQANSARSRDSPLTSAMNSKKIPATAACQRMRRQRTDWVWRSRMAAAAAPRRFQRQESDDF